MSSSAPPAQLTPLVRDVTYGSASALFFLVWDLLITLDDEVKYIWPRTHKSWLKWVFLTARYFPLASQVCGQALSQGVYLHLSLNEKALRTWYVGQVVVAALGVFHLEVVLMARVYALYRRPRWLKILFSSLIMGEICAIIIGATVTARRAAEFHPWLLISRTPASFTYLSATALLVQTVIVTLSLVRFITSGLAIVPLARLMIRDGSFVFGLLALFTMIMMAYTLLDLSYGVACYAWLVTALSCTICRTSINVVSSASERDPSTDICLTEIAFTSNGRNDTESGDS